MSRVEALLAAPRGRGLCAALPRVDEDVFDALRHSVDHAAYWQAPLDVDQTEVADDLLRPAAERVLHSAEVEWWRCAAELPDQWLVERLDDGQHPAGLPLTGTAAGLAAWRANERSIAARAERTALVDRWDVSGTWWSTPTSAVGVQPTARSRPGRGPVGLWLVEDELGWERARCWPVAPVREPRVFEVHGPEDWAQLARIYPLDVTASRAPDWRRATGRVGRWVIPDWPTVAGDYDAVHVSTWGYLTAAGRPVAVNGSASLLAGWSPDTTYWLTDCLAVSGPPADFVRDGENWRPVAAL